MTDDIKITTKPAFGSREAAQKGGSPEGLTYKQELFCAEFLKDFSAAGAARRAGYSEQVANKTAYQMLQNPKISKRINELQGNRETRTKITVDEILKRLIRIADAAETDQDFNVALRALELLGKNKAMFTDKNISEVTHKNPFASGQDDEAIERDATRMAAVVRAGAAKHPGLRVIEGDLSDQKQEEPDDPD